MPIITSHISKIEVLSGSERCSRRSIAEELAIVQEIYESDVTASIVAQRRGILPNQLMTCSSRE